MNGGIELEIENAKKSFHILLAGNPNVGKSTVFNALTGMKQHTGNWSGKTVVTAKGFFRYEQCEFTLTDLPGTYSLESGSADEFAANDAIMNQQYDAVIIVADASCLERNLNFVLTVLELTSKAVICLNLIDEAQKKGIEIDIDELSLQTGVPVVPTAARSGKGLDELKKTIFSVVNGQQKTYFIKTPHHHDIETAVSMIETSLGINDSRKRRKISLELLEQDTRETVLKKYQIESSEALTRAFEKCDKFLKCQNISDTIAEDKVKRCERIYRLCVKSQQTYRDRDRKIDWLFTSKATGIPIMILLLALIFYITIIGANAPSEWLSRLFASFGNILYDAADRLAVPDFVRGILIDGMYGTLSDVAAVMLPPMAIFFPLFGFLEDFGYLPRIVFNLDRCFQKVGTNGKQSLTMMMSFGCNACGVTGCRIFSSEREKNIAAAVNNFVPCNGRFPTLITIASLLMAGSMPLALKPVLCTAIVALAVLLSLAVSMAVTKILSGLLMKDQCGEFIFELPPYRRPQIFKILIRSLCDRTIFVFGRAVTVAAPAGMIIWLLANISIGDKTLIMNITNFLDPFARLMGLDGVILTAFILGFPANEIVLPIALMIYTGGTDNNLTQFHDILAANGWTATTAICMIIFTLMHFPCATTCMTVFKETKSFRWTLLSLMIPTLCGILCCIAVNAIAHLF